MDKIDKFFQVDPTLAEQRPKKYERWRTGLACTAIGFLAITVGVGVDQAFGLEIGADVGLGGLGATYLGAGYAALNLVGLRSNE